MPWTNDAIARLFENMAGLLELKGENVFKIRAYQRAARAIEQHPEPLELLVKEGREEDLRAIPGVGEAIASKIVELVQTGKVQAYEQLKAQFPPGVLTLMEIPGIGPKTALRLVQELGVQTLEDLEQAILDGRVASLPRLGPKSAENILKALQATRRKETRIPLGQALPVAEAVVYALKERLPSITEALPVGSIRRWRDTVGDIDIMVVAPQSQEVIDTFVRLPLVAQVLAHGPKKGSVLVHQGLQVDLRVVDADAFGSMLQYFTGSKQHNILLRDYANRKGLSLSEYGITDLKSGHLEKFPTEEGFYARLGLPWIPPELREGLMEIERAEQGTLPHLVRLEDIKGDLQMHTDWSDGQASAEAMVATAKALGYEYIAITDHSQGLGVARGLTPERLAEQKRLLQALEVRYGIRVFHGAEVDIRADGSLDLPDEALAQLDLVVASVHTSLQQPREKMTQRVIRALRNPYVTILGHPTSRLLGEREPIDIDLEAVFRAALQTGVALEINASPQRLDLKDTHIFRAREVGIPLVISTDAHSTEGLRAMRFGVGQARRGWCEASAILNTRPLRDLEQWLTQRRRAS
ncbi:MAG: DNA polymerase/3'-5' exonuclease PolX [Dehalococcoidia bacterium]|nr:DNA polymerase/3'-5' exonuclease PolX [Dehalococcoidia bacterium]MDW8119706.1 DNA polymerase/3'-5' exonuclease PolX [Chloroflexota bacterium]